MTGECLPAPFDTWIEKFPPDLPEDAPLEGRQQAMHAALEFIHCFNEWVRLRGRGDHEQADQVMRGAIEAVRGIDPSHISWAFIEIYRFPDSGSPIVADSILARWRSDWLNEFPPSVPLDMTREGHRRLFHAAEVLVRKVLKAARLHAAGNTIKAKQVENGIVGFLMSGSFDPCHISWALIELYRFPEGGHA